MKQIRCERQEVEIENKAERERESNINRYKKGEVEFEETATSPAGLQSILTIAGPTSGEARSIQFNSISFYS